jgi:hypothetical protein
LVLGCYDVSLPQTPSVTDKYIKYACVSEQNINCLRKTESIFYSNSSQIGECYNKCPLECSVVRYDFTISSSLFPTVWYASILANDSSFNKVINKYFDQSINNFITMNYTNNYAGLRDSIARINVFYEDLQFVQVDETPSITVIILLGTLGGNLGNMCVYSLF